MDDDVYTTTVSPNDVDDYQHLNSLNFVVKSILTPIICITGSVGNGLNILILWNCRTKRLVGIPYIYLRWLAVADFGTIAVWSSYTVFLQYDPRTWSKPTVGFITYALLFLENSFNGASDVLIMVLTIDRYVLVCWPLKAQAWRNGGLARAAVAFVYVFSFLFHVPWTFNENMVQKWDADTNKSYYTYETIPEITESVAFKYVWYWSEILLFRIITVISVVILNPRIVTVYRRSTVRRSTLQQGQRPDEEKTRKQERRLVTLLLATSMIFVVCMLPSLTMYVLSFCMSDDQLNATGVSTFKNFANLAKLVNHALNFYVYNLVNSDFRKEFQELFAPCCVQRDRLQSTGLSNMEPGWNPTASHGKQHVSTQQQLDCVLTSYKHQSPK